MKIGRTTVKPACVFCAGKSHYVISAMVKFNSNYLLCEITPKRKDLGKDLSIVRGCHMGLFCGGFTRILRGAITVIHGLMMARRHLLLP